jgi:hypothetical protein
MTEKDLPKKGLETQMGLILEEAEETCVVIVDLGAEGVTDWSVLDP